MLSRSAQESRETGYENSPDVGYPRGNGSLQARSPVVGHRGDELSGAGPRRRRRGPDDGGLPVGVRGGEGVPGPPGVRERGGGDGQPRREERRLSALRGFLRNARTRDRHRTT